MRLDVLALGRFYSSPLGQAAARAADRRVKAIWPNAKGADMLGVGYALPYLESYLETARRVVSAMPAQQGVTRWPGDRGNLATLSEEARFPFPDAMFDYALLSHALEEAQDARALLREVWRVLAPEGRLMILAPNRASLWSIEDATPFGHGRPYSRAQLRRLLEEAMFQPAAWARALYFPPLNWNLNLAAADGLERAGQFLWPQFGGMILAEAVKRLYVGAPRRAPAFPIVRPARANHQPARARDLANPDERF